MRAVRHRPVAVTVAVVVAAACMAIPDPGLVRAGEADDGVRPGGVSDAGAVEAPPEDPPAIADVLTSPPRILASIAPGSSSTATLTVVNRASAPRSFTIARHDLEPDESGETYASLAPPGSQPAGAGDWLEVDARRFQLAPGARREVEVSVAVPDGTLGGGHYGALVVETSDDRPDGLDLRVRLVTHVLVNVPGDVQYAVELRDLQVEQDGGGAVVVAELENVGNIHAVPTVEVEVDGWLGRTASATVELPETMPGGRREVRERIELPLPAGRFAASAVAHLETSPPDARDAEAGPERFWAATRAALGGIAALVVLVVLVPAGLLWRRRRELDRLVAEELALDEDDVEPSSD